MLKEITQEDLMKRIGAKAFVVNLVGGVANPLSDLLTGSRILIDEEEKATVKRKGPGKEIDSKKDHYDKEQMILKAWNGGERTIKEIMEITGFSYPTVRKYIPTTING